MIWKTENRYIEGKNFGEKMKGTAQYNNDTLFFLHYSRNKTIIAVLLKERRDDWNVLGEYLSGREKEVVDIMMTLFNTKADYSRSVAEQVKTIMNVSFRYAITNKVILANPVDGIGLPKAERTQQKSGFRTRNIDTQKTLTMEQIQILLEKSKDTPIHMQVMFNVLMGLRRSEINGVKYSDVDYINHMLKVERQLGRIHNTVREDFAPKTFTKQEVGLKTRSSYREIPIPDYVFEAILEERRIYEKNRNRRKEEFQDLDYICCSTLGRARSKGFHCKYYKQLLAENGLPDIRWHDLRSTYCTLLLKESFNPKAVSKLMGHAKELITMDVYADNRGIIADGVPEIEEYMKEVLPNPEETEIFKKELLEIVVDVTEFLPDAV